MAKKKKKGRFEIARDVYVLDTRGTASEGERIRRRADSDADKVKRLFEDESVQVVSDDADNDS